MHGKCHSTAKQGSVLLIFVDGPPQGQGCGTEGGKSLIPLLRRRIAPPSRHGAAAPRHRRWQIPNTITVSSPRSSLPARRRCAPAREKCASRPRKRDDGRVLPPFSLPTSHKSGRQAHLRQKWSKPPQVCDHTSHRARKGPKTVAVSARGIPPHFKPRDTLRTIMQRISMP